MMNIAAQTAEHWHHHHGPWFLIPLLFWVVVIALAVRFRGRHHHHHQGGMRVLDEAFARGEITAEDYRSRREVMREVRAPQRRRRGPST